MTINNRVNKIEEMRKIAHGCSDSFDEKIKKTNKVDGFCFYTEA